MKTFYADCAGIAPARYVIHEEDNGGWHTKETDLAADPFRHQYTMITDETIVRNSHGTDTDDYHDETSLTPDEAIRLLQGKDPAAAETLRRFEASCLEALEACGSLVSGQMPECAPLGLLYNSGSTTVLAVQNADGTESAVKACRMLREDRECLERFLDNLQDAGGSRYLIRIEKMLTLPDGSGSDTVLIKMPLLKPAFPMRLIARGSRISYRTGPGTNDSGYICRCGAHTAQALADLHRLGWVHHDVRPENFLVDSAGQFVLGDLDSAGPVSGQYRRHFRSSMLYRAPELRLRLPYGTEIDCYAWGKSFLHILATAPCPEQYPRPEAIRVTDVRSGLARIEWDGCTFPARARDENALLAQTAARAMDADPTSRLQDGEAILNDLRKSGSGNKIITAILLPMRV